MHEGCIGGYFVLLRGGCLVGNAGCCCGECSVVIVGFHTREKGGKMVGSGETGCLGRKKLIFKRGGDVTARGGLFSLVSDEFVTRECRVRHSGVTSSSFGSESWKSWGEKWFRQA